MSGLESLRGICGQCRHANHETDDAAEDAWACPWIGSISPTSPCGIQFRDSGQFVFERYDGTNGTWRRDTSFREIPNGYERREVFAAADASPSVSQALAGENCGGLTLSLDDDSESEFLFLQNEPEVFCFSDSESWWRRLWTGGDQGSGSVVVTAHEIAFVRSNSSQRLRCQGPRPVSAADLDDLIASQTGIRVPLVELTEAWLSAEGLNRYGAGRADISEVSITYGIPVCTIRFRFLGRDAGSRFLAVIQRLAQQIR